MAELFVESLRVCVRAGTACLPPSTASLSYQAVGTFRLGLGHCVPLHRAVQLTVIES